MTAQKDNKQRLLRQNAVLKQQLRELTTRVEALNKELEDFSYSVSHDLRAPLRSIRGFSEILLDHCADKLDSTGKEFLGRICQSSAHMDRLIEDLAKFSRLSKIELSPQEVDLGRIAASITNELARTDPDRKVLVRIQPGLVAHGDERLLRIVMDHLLRNAWKFTGKQKHPEVEIGRQDAFYVRDNGAGFEMKYAARLFRVFQRLHSASEFPGNGIGLAIVQRIINRHGGKVWAEAEPGKGATFFFQVPKESTQ